MKRTFIAVIECRADIREEWRITAESEAEARQIWETEEGASAAVEYLGEVVQGNEEDRELVELVAERRADPEAAARFPLSDWRYEVANGDTLRGFDEWRAAKIEADEEPAELPPVPADFSVQPIQPGTPEYQAAEERRDLATCGTCGRSWDDGISTQWTPTPAGRCPFEYFHA